MPLRLRAPSHLSSKIALIAALFLFASWPTVHAQTKQKISPAELQERLQEAKSNPELEQRLYALGKKVAAVCANCHGPHKIREFLDVPYLEGQNPAYLVEQIRQFSQGERKNTFMEGILRAMNRDEMVGMVLFYEKERPPVREPANAALYAQGKKQYERVCINCHQADGHGNERLPRIAGQHMGYVEMTLKRYRDGSRVRYDPNMAFVAKNMTDQDIQAVATFLETMP